jgi:dTDP-4-amino-4,6-dideoxygalactose transaminase
VVARERDRGGMIPIIKPLMDEREAAAARRVILSGWVTQGPEVAAFEREFADFVGAAHAVAASSCTTALHLALLAAGVQPGDEVVTVSHSYIATANAVRYCGATPVFVDVEPDTFNIDPARIEGAVTPRTRAILCVHQMGMPCDLAAIVSIARRHALRVVEDAACASGSEVRWDGRWEKIGKPHGDIACFSFHPRKVMSTGDGGMITTNHADWDAQCRLLRQHGMSVPDTVRHGASQVIFESYPVVGFNYRLTDIQAAVGREQLKRLPGVVETRRALAERYRTLLSGVRGLRLPREPEWARSNWQSYCVRLPDGCDQRAVMQHMLDREIATRRGVMCTHREPSYEGSAAPGALPHSEQAQEHCIILPLYPQMTRDDQQQVADALQRACAR